MKTIYEIVNECQQTKSLNDKINIISQADDDAKVLLKLTEDNLIIFNLASSVINDEMKFNDTSGNHIVDFINLVDDILNKGTMNNEIRQQIRNTLSLYTKDEAIVLQNVLLKDLRIGAGVKILKKALGNDFIEEFELMKCTAPSEKATTKLIKLSDRLICQPKFDGQRVVVRYNIDDESINTYSRNGKPVLVVNDKILNEAKECCKLIADGIKNHPTLSNGKYIWLDGEVIHDSFVEGSSLTETEKFEKFNALMQTKSSNGENNNIFKVFTYFVTRFDGAIGNCSEISRLQFLQDIFDKNDYDNIELIKYVIHPVSNMEEANKFINNYYDECLTNGYEGAVIKNADASYELKRSAHWLKMKPNDNADLTIVSIIEGTGKYKDHAGCLMLEGEIYNPEGNLVFVKTGCGSGLNDEIRKHIWENQSDYIGKTVEVKYASITVDNSLRHARFIRMRDDK